MYCSDFYILDTAARIFDLNIGMAVPGDPIQDPKRKPDLEHMTSLNHAVHIHNAADFHADEWMFVEVDSPWARDGRTMTRSRIFTRDGGLIATCEQEVSTCNV